MRCPYQTITIHKEIIHHANPLNYEESISFGECIGSKCPFYRKITKHNKKQPWLLLEQCKRAEKEKR